MYACTIFVSAFLLFLVQPIIGKAILPWFGGSAAVWTTCLLFFQLLLPLGYLYAYALVERVGSRTQAKIHLALLVLSLIALPLTPNPAYKPGGSEEPIGRILTLLLTSVGLPYFLLSTTSPLLQAWYLRANHKALPYRLFALSNFGSMLALIAYPVLLEPRLSTQVQTHAWSAGYGLFVVLAAVCAWHALALPDAPRDEADAVESPPPSPAQGLLWLALPACASVLLLAITNHISQDVAAIPFFWVLTLALYLLSFIMCFESDRWYVRWLWVPLMFCGFGGVTYILSDVYRVTNLRILIPLFGGTLLAACMVCNGELARLKPAPRHLTSFYVAVSVGGALGGIFVAVLAPLLFAAYYELQMGMVATAALVVWLLARDAYRSPADPEETPKAARLRLAARVAVVILAVAALGMTIALKTFTDAEVRGNRLVDRNFYGELRVKEIGQSTDTIRQLKHGIIIHGEEFVAGRRHGKPISYYGPTSGIGLAMRLHHPERPRRIGTIGLGTGTMAAFGRAGDVVRFYEINPLVVDVAHTQFDFVQSCRGEVDIVLGDARLTMEHEPPQSYDVLVVDAFSSDAIPVHLLTREAMELYFRHLKPDGVLAVHISNKYLDLEPVIARHARDLQAQVVVIQDEDDDAREGLYSSTWMLVSKEPSFRTSTLGRKGDTARLRDDLAPWTDDYSNLLQILKHAD